MSVVKYTFFWDGPFSQWHLGHPFEIDGMTFNCAEQWMMYNKAMLFGDTEIAKKIMATESPREQKKLGRQVKGYDDTKWQAVARDVVVTGNIAKFHQHPDLLEILMMTGDTLLVEASPFDKIWGIGLDAETAAKTPEAEWPGTNWLGIALTEVRDENKSRVR